MKKVALASFIVAAVLGCGKTPEVVRLVDTGDSPLLQLMNEATRIVVGNGMGNTVSIHNVAPEKTLSEIHAGRLDAVLLFKDAESQGNVICESSPVTADSSLKLCYSIALKKRSPETIAFFKGFKPAQDKIDNALNFNAVDITNLDFNAPPVIPPEKITMEVKALELLSNTKTEWHTAVEEHYHTAVNKVIEEKKTAVAPGKDGIW